MHDAIVIGAGVNGLVTAGYLARAGWRVIVLERGEAPGGTAALVRDAGWVPPAVARDLGLASHGLEITYPDPRVVTPLANGGHLRLWRDPAKTAAEIKPLSVTDAGRWPEFERRMTRLSGFLATLYAAPPLVPTSRRIADMLRLAGVGRRVRGLGKTGMIDLLRTLPMSVAELLDEWFENDALKGTLAASGIRNICQGPRSAGTGFLFLHHRVGDAGVGDLVPSLVAAARGHRAELRTSAEVARILVTDGRASGVALTTGEQITARYVLSSADPARTFLGLLEPGQFDPEFLHAVRNIRFRGAAAQVRLTLGERPRFAGDEAGAISISPSVDYLERAYDDAKHGRVSARPYLEAHLLPGEPPVLSVHMQYAPYKKEGGWSDADRTALGQSVVRTLGEYAPKLRDTIVTVNVVTPKDLEVLAGVTEGSLYHGELTLDQILFMRPLAACAHYRTPLAGLYLCGAGSHPGGGIAGGPGRNAARTLLNDAKRS